MRGLLQQRDYLLSRGEKLGKSFLIFGSRSSEEGLFHDEISDYSNRGILNVVCHVYSREPGKRKQYVTDELYSAETREALQPMLNDSKCHVFICGSANMAESTKQCLRDMSPFFDFLVDDGRLHCDVFGAVSSSSKPPSSRVSYTLGAEAGEIDSFLDELDFSSMGGRSGNIFASCIGRPSSALMSLSEFEAETTA